MLRKGDIRIDFCAEIDDPGSKRFRCKAVVDEEEVEPGQVEMSSTPKRSSPCYTWYAEVTGLGKKHAVDVQCKKINGGNQIELDEYTHSLTYSKY